MALQYSYKETLAASEKIRWKVEDLIGGSKKLDFTRPFMPESLAPTEPLSFLSPPEKLILNQIRGNTYLCIFGIVEEFILPFVMDHTRPQLAADDYEVRSLLRFAEEEAKHIHLFREFRKEFDAGFGNPCAVIGPPQDVAREVLSHDPFAVAIAIMQIEWMTQRHYLDSVKDDRGLDPLFKSLLKHHWMEEAQHAKIDTMMVLSMAQTRTKQQIEQAIGEYLQIGAFLDNGLKQQVEFDLESWSRATGRTLTPSEAQTFREVQLRANRWTYLGSGMTHENFLAALENIQPAARKKIESIAPSFC